LSELINEAWITVPADDIGGSVLTEAFRLRGLAVPTITVTTFSIHLRHSLAAHARFIAALPESVLRFNKDQALQELPIDLPEPRWPVLMVTAKKRASNPVIKRFVDCAREVVRSFVTGLRNRSNRHPSLNVS
jgi:DNA-binding transcriptional LysR family regulator